MEDAYLIEVTLHEETAIECVYQIWQVSFIVVHQ